MEKLKSVIDQFLEIKTLHEKQMYLDLIENNLSNVLKSPKNDTKHQLPHLLHSIYQSQSLTYNPEIYYENFTPLVIIELCGLLFMHGTQQVPTNIVFIPDELDPLSQSQITYLKTLREYVIKTIKEIDLEIASRRIKNILEIKNKYLNSYHKTL